MVISRITNGDRLFIPCYIEAVFQEAGIAAVRPRCRLPARDQAYCGQRMAMDWNTPSIFPFIHSRVHRVLKSSFLDGHFPSVPSPNNYLCHNCSIESSLGEILPRPSRA
jgi:hypothetical protein